MKNKLVISLLAILVIVLGVFAYTISLENSVSSKTFEKEITKVETVTNSDQTADIENDLNETNIDNIDSELLQIEAELSSN